MLKLANELLKIAKAITAAQLVKTYTVLSNNYAIISIYSISHGSAMSEAIKTSQIIQKEMKSIVDLLDSKNLIEKENLPDVFLLSSDSKVKINMTYNVHLLKNPDTLEAIIDVLENKNFKKVNDN